MKVTYEASTYKKGPHKYEAGTPNIADVIAFGAAVDYLEGLGMAAVRAHEVKITQYAIDTLGAVEGVRIYGPRDAREKGGAVTFNYGALHPHDLSQVLDVPVLFFFDDMPEAQANFAKPAAGATEGRLESFEAEAMSRRETMELVRAYYRIADPLVRRRVADLVKSIAGPIPGAKRRGRPPGSGRKNQPPMAAAG